MRNKLFKSLAAAVLGTAILAAAPVSGPLGDLVAAQASANENYLKISKSAIGKTKRVSVGFNKSMVIDLPGDAHDILVANPAVADAITRTSRRIYIFAKQVGQTNLFIFDSAGNQLLNLELLIERDITGLEHHIEKYVPGSDVKVEMMSDNVVLTGTVPTPLASARALRLAEIFVTGGEATTNQFSNSSGGGGSGASIIFDDDEDRRTSQVVNLLRIEGEDQVHLKVTVAEIQRTIVKQLGIDLAGAPTAGGRADLASLGNAALRGFTDNPLGFGSPFGMNEFAFNYNNGSESLQAIIRAMDQAGVMRTLAEPTLTAISGETASFKVGGEYNVANGKQESEDGVQYEFKTIEYGISLAFTPVVLSPGRISLRIKTQVSEPTTEGTYVIPRGGAPSAPAPGIRRREAETSVELPSGGSMVIAGLLKDDVRQASAGYPGLKNIPVLGTLFRSREFQRYETELVIIATPYLVRPTARKNLVRPDENFAAAADGAANFLGRINRVYGRVEGKVPNGRYHGNIGFIYK